jgi:hypothetical protein
MRALGLAACVGLLVFAGCGGAGSAQTTATDGPAPRISGTDAKERTQRLLDDWSDALFSAILTAKERAKAAQSGRESAYKRADRSLRHQLERIKMFASQGRAVTSRFDPALRRVVVADGDAWQEWAAAILAEDEISLPRAREIADLAIAGFVKHEDAYAAIGQKPPPAFQRRPDQQ